MPCVPRTRRTAPADAPSSESAAGGASQTSSLKQVSELLAKAEKAWASSASDDARALMLRAAVAAGGLPTFKTAGGISAGKDAGERLSRLATAVYRRV